MTKQFVMSTNVGTISGFVATSAGGTTIEFNPVINTDVIIDKNELTKTVRHRYQSINCMKEYEGKTFDELRFEDYIASRK